MTGRQSYSLNDINVAQLLCYRGDFFRLVIFSGVIFSGVIFSVVIFSGVIFSGVIFS